MFEYPSIRQFRDTVRSIKFDNVKEPVEFVRTTKIHGANCSVASHFGVEGVGEGYVYTSVCGRYKFKMKGSKHKVSEKSIRTPEELQALEDVTNFVGSVVLEPRLAQGIDYLNELGIPVESKSTGAYIKWVVQDVLKEEGDLISSLGLNKTNVTKEVSRVAREYFQGTVYVKVFI